MDATTIRLILIVVGAILILGLYLWERSRDPDGEEEDEEDFGDEGYEDQGYDEDDAPYGASTVREPRDRREPSLGALDSRDREAHEPEDARARREPDAGDPVQTDSGGLQPLLIQLSVAKRQGDFDGMDILDVAESCGLRPGNMDIFHCLDEFDDGPRIYFSMASMVKPGTFPFDNMEGFATPGVMLFAQLKGDPEDLTILEEMIATARKIATTLGGDVLDDTRRPLTVRKEEDMRKAVLANEARHAHYLHR